MALQTYKGKLLGAKKGYELLKKKSDALKVGACCASVRCLTWLRTTSHGVGKGHHLLLRCLKPSVGKLLRCE